MSKIYRSEGEHFATYVEIARQLEQAEQRAQQAEQRASMLAERLRAAGIDPNQL